MSESSSTGGGCLLQGILIALKLFGVLTLSWWWVWSPTIAFVGFLSVICYIIGILEVLDGIKHRN